MRLVDRFDPELPIVLVHWVDAQLVTGWDAYQEPTDLAPALTVGLLLRRTAKTIEIAQSANAGGEFDSVFVIPRKQVLQICYLVPKKRRSRK